MFVVLDSLFSVARLVAPIPPHNCDHGREH